MLYNHSGTTKPAQPRQLSHIPAQLHSFAMQRVIVQAPVATGSEITVDYIGSGSAFMSRAQRQHRLAALWGFECQCELCSAPHAAVAASDLRRQQMAEADATVVEAVVLQNAEAAVAGKCIPTHATACWRHHNLAPVWWRRSAIRRCVQRTAALLHFKFLGLSVPAGIARLLGLMDAEQLANISTRAALCTKAFELCCLRLDVNALADGWAAAAVACYRVMEGPGGSGWLSFAAAMPNYGPAVQQALQAGDGATARRLVATSRRASACRYTSQGLHSVATSAWTSVTRAGSQLHASTPRMTSTTAPWVMVAGTHKTEQTKHP
jgi:hypothetical protein